MRITEDMPNAENPEHLEMAPALTGLTAEEIPDKLYFRIGEVARLAAIKPYVLRFWETEFAGLGPKKSGTGHRLYRRKDVELVLEIKRLLYDQRFTIEGARKLLENRPKPEAGKSVSKPQTSKAIKVAARNTQPQANAQAGLFLDSSPILDSVRRELSEILAILK
jgi:DNA-binding transcriptional MerR regulator